MSILPRVLCVRWNPKNQNKTILDVRDGGFSLLFLPREFQKPPRPLEKATTAVFISRVLQNFFFRGPFPGE